MTALRRFRARVAGAVLMNVHVEDVSRPLFWRLLRWSGPWIEREGARCMGQPANDNERLA
jgi:hypothetical protein